MAQVTISGSIKVIGKTQQVSDKFSKRELVVTEPSGQRPQHIPIEFTQDRTSLLDSFRPGEEVTVTCYVNGREWTGRDGVTKYFLSLSGNRIERAGGAAPTGGNAGGYQAAAPPPTMADMPAGADDDLPF
jgi:single-strand DNA-binding protein